MSRVKTGEKWVNTHRYNDSVYNQSKMVRIHGENEDYHKAKKLSHWLFVKYDMSYKAFRGKPKKRRKELKQEFWEDTGVKPKEKEIL